MPIKVHAKPPTNPIEDLAELEIFPTQSITEKDFSIGMVSRFSEGSVYDEDKGRTYLVRFLRAYIQLTQTNCFVPQHGRAGDAPRLNRRRTTTVAERSLTSTASNERGAGIDVSVGGDFMPSGSLKGNLQYSGESKATKTASTKVEYEENETDIVHETALRWSIRELDDRHLSGRHAPSEHLCYVEPTEKDGSIQAKLYVLPSHIDFDVKAGASFMSRMLRPNVRAIVKALVAKEIKKLNDGHNYKDGRIILSTSDVEFEVDGND